MDDPLRTWPLSTLSGTITPLISKNKELALLSILLILLLFFMLAEIGSSSALIAALFGVILKNTCFIKCQHVWFPCEPFHEMSEQMFFHLSFCSWMRFSGAIFTNTLFLHTNFVSVCVHHVGNYSNAQSIFRHNSLIFWTAFSDQAVTSRPRRSIIFNLFAPSGNRLRIKNMSTLNSVNTKHLL